jgi:hypothetical protein
MRLAKSGHHRFVHGVVQDLGHQIDERVSSVPPIYMPGRRRTGSSPSRTSIVLAD